MNMLFKYFGKNLLHRYWFIVIEELNARKRSHLHESPNPMGQFGMVLTQHHWVEVFLEEVNERTLGVNTHVFISNASRAVIVDFICGQHMQSEDGWVPLG